MIVTWVLSMLVSPATQARESALQEPKQAEERGEHEHGEKAVQGHRDDRVYLGLAAGMAQQALDGVPKMRSAPHAR
jgi:hypothetical protein